MNTFPVITEFTVAAGEDHYVKQVHGEDGPEERVVEYAVVTVTSREGRRWFSKSFYADPAIVDGLAEALAKAEALADQLRFTIATEPHYHPEDDILFLREGDPIYGSDAWGPEQEYELACFEADCFGEPRPIWR